MPTLQVRRPPFEFDGDVPFLVLEPTEGLSLRAWADDHRRRLTWPDLAEVHGLIDGVCAAVAVAHRMRALAGAPVLHGLLSPESVLLSRASDSSVWDVCVMDFALATLPGVTWTQPAASPLSDPRSPEQLADREAVSAAGDVFSLGVLLASMLVPFALPARPKCWAHAVEAQHPEAVRGLLVSMRADVPPAVYVELVKALARDPSSRHADADRLRTALRRVPWEPLAELAPPPRLVDPAEATMRERGDEHSKPMMRLPSALLADLGPLPMNLRASVPTQKMFNGAAAAAQAPARREPTQTSIALDPPAHEPDARSFAGPSQVTTVDALVAFRELAREGAFDGTDARTLPPDEEGEEEPEEPTGPVPVVPANDLFGDELAGERAFPREPTRALELSPGAFAERPSDGMLVSGMKLQSLALKAPRKPPVHHEGTSVTMVAPEPDEPAEEPEARAELPGETPADPWGEGVVPEALARPSMAPMEPDWAAQPRMPTMAPPPPPNPWMDTPQTVQMTLPLPAAVMARAPVAAEVRVAPKAASSLRVAAVVMAVVVTVAFALGLMAGR